MSDHLENHREGLLEGLRRFVVAARNVAGGRRISLVGAIVTAKPNPKDIDVLVVVADDADLAPLAMYARRLQGHAQSFNDDLDTMTLSTSVVAAPPVTLWPVVERRGHLPSDLEEVVAGLEHAV